MRINTKFTVAVHLLALMQLNEGPPAASEQMAASVGSHPVVVRQVMSSLKKAGLIETQSGVPGGRLTKPPEKISLLEILQAVRGKPDAPLFDLHPAPNPLCPVGRNIKNALEAPLRSAQAALERDLEKSSLRDVTSYILEQETKKMRSSGAGSGHREISF